MKRRPRKTAMKTHFTMLKQHSLIAMTALVKAAEAQRCQKDCLSSLARLWPKQKHLLDHQWSSMAAMHRARLLPWPSSTWWLSVHQQEAHPALQQSVNPSLGALPHHALKASTVAVTKIQKHRMSLGCLRRLVSPPGQSWPYWWTTSGAATCLLIACGLWRAALRAALAVWAQPSGWRPQQ